MARGQAPFRVGVGRRLFVESGVALFQGQVVPVKEAEDGDRVDAEPGEAVAVLVDADAEQAVRTGTAKPLRVLEFAASLVMIPWIIWSLSTLGLPTLG
jgi:hypothetical protein